jgi:hypothetical protein
MNRNSVKLRSNLPVVIDAEPTPARGEWPAASAPEPQAVQAAQEGPFVRFQYSTMQVSISNGRAKVRSRSTKVENGVLTSETFEGEVDPWAYHRAVADAQRQFIAQTTAMLESMTAFLPFGRRGRRRD